MTFELSHRIKLLALAALVLALGGAGILVLNRHQSTPPVAPAVTSALVHPAQPKHAAQAPPSAPAPTAPSPVQIDPSLPSPLRLALRRSTIVVAVVYAPGDAVDEQVLAQAEAGARTAGAGFAALDVRDDRVAAATAAWMTNLVDPAVVVVRRPGTIAVELDGYADSATVAQAVLDSQR